MVLAAALWRFALRLKAEERLVAEMEQRCQELGGGLEVNRGFPQWYENLLDALSLKFDGCELLWQPTISADLSNTRATNDDVARLAKLPGAEVLNLKHCLNIDDGVAKSLAEMTDLAILNLSGTRIGDRTLERLSEISSLQQLFLAN